MKMKTLFLTLLLASTSAHATDWNQLIELAPIAKKERIQLDEKGYVTANIIKLPSGKLRFLSFNNFGVATKPVIQVESKETEISELCQFAVLADKPFKAKLMMSVNAAASLSTGIFNTGNKLENFDNPVKVSKPVFTFSKSRTKWSLYDADVMKNAKGSIGDYYLSRLNEQLQKSDGDTMTMDLSNLNALACDLMSGNIVIQVNQVVEVETGMPMQKIWLELDQYAAIYRKFWGNQPLVTSSSQTPIQNQMAEAVALGVSVGLTMPADRLLQSPPRLQKFLASVKTNVRNLEPVQKVNVKREEVYEAWNANIEYAIPENLVSRQTRTVLDEPAVVKFTR